MEGCGIRDELNGLQNQFSGFESHCYLQHFVSPTSRLGNENLRVASRGSGAPVFSAMLVVHPS